MERLMLRFTAAMSSVATSKEQMQPLTVKILVSQCLSSVLGRP